jgi:hypothetical protein
MKLNIPDIGDIITLESEWTFMLHPEARNNRLAKFYGFEHTSHGEQYWSTVEGMNAMHVIYESCKLDKVGKLFDYSKYQTMIVSYIKCNPDKINGAFKVTLPAKTELGVDRVYIRKGARDFSSLSFIIKNGKFKGARFWAKLQDVNCIDVKQVS